MKKIVLAICGASGSLYGINLLKHLVSLDVKVYLIVSSAGKQVMKHETGYSGHDLCGFLVDQGIDAEKFEKQVEIIGENDFFSQPASGSFVHDGMVIAPCTMGTLGALASGISGNIIHRAADVCMKEKRPLILLARETPLSSIHLKNMLTLSGAGAVIMPASPSFYTFPATINDLIDTVTGRVLNHLKIKNNIIKEWGGTG